jgi:hypothetical protein
MDILCLFRREIAELIKPTEGSWPAASSNVFDFFRVKDISSRCFATTNTTQARGSPCSTRTGLASTQHRPEDTRNIVVSLYLSRPEFVGGLQDQVKQECNAYLADKRVSIVTFQGPMVVYSNSHSSEWVSFTAVLVASHLDSSSKRYKA